MKKLFKKIYYICGTVYRGIIGAWHNLVNREQDIVKNIKKEVIGKSVKNKEILAYSIGHGDKKLLIVGGIHGNEIGTVKLAKKIIGWSYKNCSGLKTGVTVIPVLNIEGYEKAKQNLDYIHRGKIGRFNANSVDLNRNFPAQNFKQYSEWGIGKN
ncbi:MAG: M14 family zinc carboxypeptidase, partial [Patescibacteria group bacterium]